MRRLLARAISMLNEDASSLKTFFAAYSAGQSESELLNTVGRLSLGATGDAGALTNALSESIGELIEIQSIGPNHSPQHCIYNKEMEQESESAECKSLPWVQSEAEAVVQPTKQAKERLARSHEAWRLLAQQGCGAGGSRLVPEAVRHQVGDWLEWEERVLRPAAQSRQPARLATALAQLDQACTPGQLFLGHSLTLADIAIFSALRSAQATTEAGHTFACLFTRLEVSA